MLTTMPQRADIEQTHRTIAPYIHRTPVLTSQSIDALVGAHLYFKCENFQKVGAFKFRGGIHAVVTLPENLKSKGVATHSSGNHAQAIALAAKMAGTQAYIIMPETAPLIKQKAVAGYGAEITFCAPTLEARESTLAEKVAKTGAHFIHPYDDYRVIAGQATCGKELLEDVAELDTLIAPVGGGGLLAGTALAAHYFKPQTKVYAAEPSGADDAYCSFKAGHLIPSVKPNTIADGLLTSVGQKNFPIIQEHVTDIFTVDDQEIVAAMRLVWERMKIIIEPSCAVPLAALIKNKAQFAGQHIGVILTGGNVDLGKLPF